MSTTEFRHRTIGIINARTTAAGVIQFLRMQYATLRDRFAEPVMKQYRANEVLDASSPGDPSTPTEDQPFDDGFSQDMFEQEQYERWSSDVNSLHLSITVPKRSDHEESLESRRALPVFVFINDGARGTGTNGHPHYDMAQFVRLSASQDRPVIAVTLNYRLGAAGLLTSAAMRAAGYKPNNALRDQRMALLWIRRHISGFGGDPSNVTLVDQGAGVLSANYHLFSRQPLFHRVVLASANFLLSPPKTFDEAENEYVKAVEVLGLENLPPAQQVEAVVAAKPSPGLLYRLAAADIQMGLVVDDDMCPAESDFSELGSGETQIPGASWCEAAIIRDSEYDGVITNLKLRHRRRDSAAAFSNAIQSAFRGRPAVAKRLLGAYGISSGMDDGEAFRRIVEVADDLQYYVPSRLLAEHFRRHGKNLNLYTFRFNDVDPAAGPWKTSASHILDLAFFAWKAGEVLDIHQPRNATEAFATDILRLAYGEDPWSAWSRVNVYGPGGEKHVENDAAGESSRRKALMELVEVVGLDALNAAFKSFLSSDLSLG